MKKKEKEIKFKTLMEEVEEITPKVSISACATQLIYVSPGGG